MSEHQTSTPEVAATLPEVSFEGVQRVLDHAASYSVRALQLRQKHSNADPKDTGVSQDLAVASEYSGNAILMGQVLDEALPLPEGQRWGSEIQKRGEALVDAQSPSSDEIVPNL
jgi:hypothetical protein